MAKAKEKALPKAIPVSFKTLVGLLGKEAKAPEVLALIAKMGKTKVSSDFIVAKEAGFDFSLDVPPGGRKKVLSTLFLFSPGADDHRGYEDLPKGFAFTTREALFAKLSEPARTWKIGKGKVPASTPDPAWDEWRRDGIDITANYAKDGSARYFTVSLPEELMGGRDLSTDPLHFETKPHDAPPDAPLVAMALLVAWAAKKHGLPSKHAATEHGKALLARKISPRTFLIHACKAQLSSLDFVPKLTDFLDGYVNSRHEDEEARKAVDKQIARILGEKSKDPYPCFDEDFRSTFRGVVKSPFYVPDAWEAVDRIAPIFEARHADYEATGFQKPPKTAAYEKAVKLRDAVAITPETSKKAKPAIAADLADELVALIGRSLKDKEVKEILQRVSLPVGKTIDEQANPAIGVSYMGTKIDIGGKKELGIENVTFYANKQKSYIRGLGAEVQFAGFEGALPHALSLGQARDAVRKKMGKPKSTYEDNDRWDVGKERELLCTFKKQKLVELSVRIPTSWDD